MHVVVKGPRLRRVLAGRNWSQAEFARVLEVSPSTLSRWIAGRRSPSPASRGRLLALLGLSFHQVFTVVEGRKMRSRPPSTGEQQAAAGGA